MAPVTPAACAELYLFPAWQTKTIHLIRHGEGFHNVAGEQDEENYKREEFRDAHLTERGWAQAAALGGVLRGAGARVDLVMVSPLARALETAVGVFARAPAAGGGGEAGAHEPQLLMRPHSEAPGRRPAHPGAGAAGVPPMLCTELCIERRSAGHPCDQRSDLSVLRSRFPGVDFSPMGSVEAAAQLADLTDDLREPVHAVQARALHLLRFLLSRPERSIAVVSHGGFLYHMLSMLPPGAPAPPPGGRADPHAPGSQWRAAQPFDNCELRSVVLAGPTLPPPLPPGRDADALAGLQHHNVPPSYTVK